MNQDFNSLEFEIKDTEIFKIPDVLTKLNIIQNYFFPRLELLLKESLEDVQKIYNINPYEKMTFVYKPNHRKNAKTNIDDDCVHIGISGKRTKNRQLIIKKKNGKPAALHCSYLTYDIYDNGSITTVFNPFRMYVDEEYVQIIVNLLEKNKIAIEKIFRENGISYTMGSNLYFKDFIEAILKTSSNSSMDDEYSRQNLYFYSPTYYFPVSRHRGIWEVKRAFIALYPILDAFINIAEGQDYPLTEKLESLLNYYEEEGYFLTHRREFILEEQMTPISEEINIPELDSYKFIRTGLWWDVLARDQWKCCSCGRSSKKHGVTLHVDHIIPRSKGGTDDFENLQTLCWKCNIGKSNKDTTDLR